MDRPLQPQQDSIRLPLYQEPEASLPGGDYGGFLGQAYINCFPIVYRNVVTGESEQIVIKRSGTVAIAEPSTTIASFGTASTMVCIANIVMTQLYDVYVGAWFDSTASKIYIIQYRPASGGNAVKIGEIATTTVNDTVFITEITNGDTLVPAIAVSYQKSDKSSGTGYYAVSAGGIMTASSLTAIASGSFPANLGTPRIITGPFQYMNGHSYIMTLDGFIYMAGLTAAGNPDITSWNTLATVTASQYPDGGIGVFRYKNYLLAFGKDSVEFFNDAGDPPPGSTLERTDQAFIKFGAITPRMIQNFDDSIYWVAYGSNDSFGVWQMVGYVPTKISDIKVDTSLVSTLSQNSDAHYYNMQCVVLGARKHLLLNGIPYVSSADFLNSNVADTYAITSGSSCRASICAYNLDDKIWWGLNLLNGGGCIAYPRLTTSFNTPAQVGNYRQYMFLAMDLSSGTGDARDVSSCRVQYFRQNTAAGTYIDANPAGAVPSCPICVAFSTNTYWFQTERRKRINKLKVVVDGFTSVDGNVYAMYLIATPNNLYSNTGTTSQTRRIVIPTADQRYYDNNWGMMRAINVSVASITKDDMRFRAIELDLTQGTA